MLLDPIKNANVMTGLYCKQLLLFTFPSNGLSYWGLGQFKPLIDRGCQTLFAACHLEWGSCQLNSSSFGYWLNGHHEISAALSPS